MQLVQIGTDIIDQIARHLRRQLVPIHQPTGDVRRFERIDFDDGKTAGQRSAGFLGTYGQDNSDRGIRHTLQRS